MEPNRNKALREIENNSNGTTRKKEGSLPNSSERKGDINSGSKASLKDIQKKLNSSNEENNIKDPKKLKNVNPTATKEKT